MKLSNKISTCKVKNLKRILGVGAKLLTFYQFIRLKVLEIKMKMGLGFISFFPSLASSV